MSIIFPASALSLPVLHHSIWQAARRASHWKEIHTQIISPGAVGNRTNRKTTPDAGKSGKRLIYGSYPEVVLMQDNQGREKYLKESFLLICIKT